ncbi:ERG2 and Sigma1 receptor like protein [Xylariaceae sp. FL0255]|nr:ERG2 and Sigma1 receptor like protein [Xylariaceae sp. FL0255]
MVSDRTITSFLRFTAFLLSIFVPLYSYVENNAEKLYIFKPDELHDLAKRGIAAHGNDTGAIVNYIVDELKVTHPKNINPYVDVSSEWIFNNAGGAMGGMYIIHASVTEYLIIFGTTIGTEGHTGRHTADDYFHILTGEQWAYTPGDFKPEVYPPGSQHHLVRGVVKQYKMPEGCFALEYARGWIPPMMFFGFADGLFSTLDFYTLWRTAWVTGREMVGNLIRGKF